LILQGILRAWLSVKSVVPASSPFKGAKKYESPQMNIGELSIFYA
jgi:hypothetical protein